MHFILYVCILSCVLDLILLCKNIQRISLKVCIVHISWKDTNYNVCRPQLVYQL